MELSLTQIVILAVVQGVTEFLPVSSSGHLVILAAIMADGDVESLDVSDVNIVLHGGTLLSILVFYFYRIKRILVEDRRLIGPLSVATLPAVATGFALKASGVDVALSNPVLAGCLLPVTGVILILAPQNGGGRRECEDLAYKNALLIGLSQALAILPGLSRSGTTITVGLRLGLSPNAAATFSFLMAIPVIAGASVVEIASMMNDAVPSSSFTDLAHLRSLAIGAAVACTVGLASLWLLVHWLERSRFQYFAWWCIPVGVLVIIWQVFGEA